MQRIFYYSLSLLIIPAGLAADFASPAEKAQETNAFPPGMIGMFSRSSCPDGWTNEPLTVGRIPIGAATPAESGEVVGEAFVGKKANPHQHPYVMTGELTGSLMPVGGAFGLQWVLPQDFEWSGSTDERDTGLPLYAIRICRPGAPE